MEIVHNKYGFLLQIPLELWRKWSWKRQKYIYGMLFCLWGMFPPKMCENKKRSVFVRKSPPKLEMPFMLDRFFGIYLFDKYKKCDLFAELQTWLILARVWKKTPFILFLYILDIFQLLRIHLSFHKYFFSCVISNNPIKNVCRLHYSLRGCLFNRLISSFLPHLSFNWVPFRGELLHVGEVNKNLSVDQSELGK